MYCTYLRKSRSDLEAERRGQGETLSRHREELNRLADRMGITITKEYAEIVSGETIVSRPVIQRLLHDVEQGMWEGVLVVEVERLARGDTMDQGLVAQTFRYSGTKIITPNKSYDPDSETDEEYFEFGLFMSRREYKTINRRLSAGRVRSVHEGKFVGNKAPYGYERMKLADEKGYTLQIVPDEAEVVRLVYDLYTNQKLGMTTIAYRLNDLGMHPRYSEEWTTQSIRDLLRNETYAGKIRWNRRKVVKKMVDGKVVRSRPQQSDYISVQGLHEPIIDEITFRKAQDIMNAKRVAHPRKSAQIANPLTGLIICSACGRKMQQRPQGERSSGDVIMCKNHQCTGNYGSYTYLIEQRILNSLKDWMHQYELEYREAPMPAENVLREISLQKFQTEYNSIQSQITKCCEMLEKGVYTQKLFSERYAALNLKQEDVEARMRELTAAIEKDTEAAAHRKTVIPKIKNLLEVYDELSPAAKNAYLKEIIDRVYYTKKAKGKGHEEEFELTIMPLLH